MAFSLDSPNVHRAFDTIPQIAPNHAGDSALVHLEHIQEPFPLEPPLPNPPSPEAEQRALVTHYLNAVRGQNAYQIQIDDTNLMLDAPPLRPVTKVASGTDSHVIYRFAHRKSLKGQTRFSIVQTRYGLPVWQSGFSLVIDTLAPKGPLGITHSQSTLYLHQDLDDPNIEPELANPPADSLLYMPDNLSKDKLAHILGCSDPNIIKGIEIKDSKKRLLIYQYVPNQRMGVVDEKTIFETHIPFPSANGVNVPDTIGKHPYRHFFATDVLFTIPLPWPGQKYTRWRAFVEVKTGAVLYLRPLVASCFFAGSFSIPCTPSTLRSSANDAISKIFCTDPVTKTGKDPLTMLAANPKKLADELNLNRTPVNLEDLSVQDPQTLSGDYVSIDTTVALPDASADPSTGRNGMVADFTYDIATADFANAAWTTDTDFFTAVNAYYHCDSMFRMMEKFYTKAEIRHTYFEGFTSTLNADTPTPILVDPQGTESNVNAMVWPTSEYNDVEKIVFGAMQPAAAVAKPGTKVGNAADVRIVLHEFSHVLLLGSVQSVNFTFSHSAGDSLAAILCDPGSKAPDPFDTFPWIGTANAGDPGLNRRFHGGPTREVNDWRWGGSNDSTDDITTGYLREQILSTALFRIYQSLGGGNKANEDRQHLAARYMAYLIIQGIFLAPPEEITPTAEPEQFATDLMDADQNEANPIFDDESGQLPHGTTHKVIRWGFEQQGAYRKPRDGNIGLAPEVDVYIGKDATDPNDGGYKYKDGFSSTEIWNRTVKYNPRPTSLTPVIIEDPHVGNQNYIYVRLRNRGSSATNAKHVVVKGYYRAVPAATVADDLEWDGTAGGNWTEMVGDVAGTTGLTVPPGNVVVAGPLAWTPTSTGKVCILLSVTADGDPSNLDPVAGGALPFTSPATPLWWLVPFDNNIGQLVVEVKP